MEKYRLIQEHKVDFEQQQQQHEGQRQHTESGFPEVRITQQGKPRNYISYAMNLFVRSRSWWKRAKPFVTRDSLCISLRVLFLILHRRKVRPRSF